MSINLALEERESITAGGENRILPSKVMQLGRSQEKEERSNDTQNFNKTMVITPTKQRGPLTSKELKERNDRIAERDKQFQK